MVVRVSIKPMECHFDDAQLDEPILRSLDLFEAQAGLGLPLLTALGKPIDTLLDHSELGGALLGRPKPVKDLRQENAGRYGAGYSSEVRAVGALPHLPPCQPERVLVGQ